MTTPAESEQIDARFLDVARGDVGVAKHFRSSLKTLRETTTDPGFRALVDDILAGRLPPRALARSDAFDRVVAPQLERATAYLATLSPADRARLEEQGREQLQKLATQDEKSAPG